MAKPKKPAAPELQFEFDMSMIEPISRPGDGGYVPFCCALHWIVTGGGIRPGSVNDPDAWKAAVPKLMMLVHADLIDVVGIRAGSPLSEKIPGHTLAAVKVCSPSEWKTPSEWEKEGEKEGEKLSDFSVNAPSFIDCCSFTCLENWHRNDNDKLYVRGEIEAAWTHLQLLKKDVLSRLPALDITQTQPEKESDSGLSGSRSRNL